MRFGVWHLECRVQGLQFVLRVHGSWFGGWNKELRGQGPSCRVSGLEIRVQGLGLKPDSSSSSSPSSAVLSALFQGFRLQLSGFGLRTFEFSSFGR